MMADFNETEVLTCFSHSAQKEREMGEDGWVKPDRGQPELKKVLKSLVRQGFLEKSLGGWYRPTALGEGVAAQATFAVIYHLGIPTTTAVH